MSDFAVPTGIRLKRLDQSRDSRHVTTSSGGSFHQYAAYWTSGRMTHAEYTNSRFVPRIHQRLPQHVVIRVRCSACNAEREFDRKSLPS